MFKILSQYQIGGKFYGIIKNMYENAIIPVSNYLEESQNHSN